MARAIGKVFFQCRPGRLAALIIVLVSGLMACAPAPFPPIKSSGASLKEKVPPSDLEGHFIRLINEERGRQRLAPLSFSPLLARTAEAHSQDMARNNFFSHRSPDQGGTEERVKRSGYRWWAYGENIGCGQETPEKILAAWMKSSSHRENILGATYTEVGIGFIKGGECRYYWTALFGRPR